MNSEDYLQRHRFFPKEKKGFVLAVEAAGHPKGMQETPKGFPGPGALHFVDNIS